MTNNYRSRSFSFKQFKESKITSNFVPHQSPTFISSKKSNNSQIIDRTSYLGITYASPQQYYTNNTKNQKHTRIQCRLNIFKKETDNSNNTIKNKHFNQNLTQCSNINKSSDVFENKCNNPLNQTDKNQKCLYNFFAKMWKHQCRQSQQQKRKTQIQIEQNFRPKKSKSILLIRKINKRKEQILKNRQQIENSFRNKKQIPIHHTQFHFNKRQKKSKTQNSPIAARQIRSQDFTIKIHRAVQQILRLRASLKDFNQCGQRTEDDEYENAKKFDTIMMVEGGHFSQPIKKKQPQYISKKYQKLTRTNLRKTKKLIQDKKQQCQIGPWKRRNTNDFQSLF